MSAIICWLLPSAMHSNKHWERVLQLRVMRDNDPTAKALVFSQFVSTIEWLKVKLAEQGFSYRTISGSMSLQQRSKVLSQISYWCLFIH